MERELFSSGREQTHPELVHLGTKQGKEEIECHGKPLFQCFLFPESRANENKCSVKFMSLRNYILRGIGTSTRWAHSLLSKKLMKQNGLKNTFIKFSNNEIRLQKKKKERKRQKPLYFIMITFCFGV